jgi:DCC1-like thiol-disulfide oxidoreductase
MAASLPAGLTQDRAMKRFHFRARNGQMLSGAAAFVEVWARLPGWQWAARAAALPGVMAALESGYRLYCRPDLSSPESLGAQAIKTGGHRKPKRQTPGRAREVARSPGLTRRCFGQPTAGRSVVGAISADLFLVRRYYSSDRCGFEPPRVRRRPFDLSHAAMAGSSSMA